MVDGTQSDPACNCRGGEAKTWGTLCGRSEEESAALHGEWQHMWGNISRTVKSCLS
ncbi:hypothetical protein B0G71_0068 [Paraburkholderia sp. BL27I4N3]|nr:hypothetical protein B0G71_0068 [Paraburkholderia sp. BL27I4N3]